MNTTPHIPKIVLTGGPCAGKTTALCYLEQKLLERGYQVFMLPETPTLLMSGGIRPFGSGLTIHQFQEYILQSQLSLEMIFHDAASQSDTEKKIIIYDRGIMDMKAYMTDDAFTHLLKQYNLNAINMRDNLYDAAFHLVTAADGAEKYYSFATNKERLETVEEARAADERTQNVWVGTPHLRVIDNQTNFTGKLSRLLQEICTFLGEPVPIERERKYLVQLDRGVPSKIHSETVTIEQAYLRSEDTDTVHRIRQRGQNGTNAYYETTKQFIAPGENFEVENKIPEIEYFRRLSRMRDMDYRILEKFRTCFVYNSQYFELDDFTAPELSDRFTNLPAGCQLLEIELTDIQQEVEIPSWIKVIREVTEDQNFSNRDIARV